MKATFTILLFLVSISVSMGQKSEIRMNSDNFPVNIKSDKVEKSFIPAPAVLNQLKSGLVKKSEIVVDFVDFPEEAKTAFLYATSIWETILSSEIPIHVLAKWESTESSILAKSGPSVQYKGFKQAPVNNVYYPVALAEEISNEEFNNNEPDIFCTFNKNSSWYFGTDGNTPKNQYDFVTAVLHEMTHGLGFTGFINDENGTGYFDNNKNAPSIYDYFIFNNYDEQLADQSLFSSPSVELHEQLTSGKLKFNTKENEEKSANDPNWLYAPTTWRNGASIYHLNESFDGEDGLMSAYATKGKAIHNPGNKTVQILSELGWEIDSYNFSQIQSTEDTFEEPTVSINVYPNPCTNYLNIDCSDSNDVSSLQLTVTDLMGRIALNETWNDTRFNPKKQVDLSNFKPGIYLVNVIDNTLNITTQRIIKN